MLRNQQRLQCRSEEGGSVPNQYFCRSTEEDGSLRISRISIQSIFICNCGTHTSPTERQQDPVC